jgi:rhodanese-related sulfurtransferase
MESATFLLVDENGKNHSIYTGDTLFIGDVGRPDLAVKTDLTQADLAGHLYDSLHSKIIPLEDEVIVYPGHGAGSACGKNMSKETFDTLGHQKEVNYALQAKSKEEFVEQVLDGLVPPPQYFPKNVVMNKNGYESFDNILESGNKALDPDTFEDVVNANGALMLDVRTPADFVGGHIPNSIFVGLDGSFAVWVGTLITDLKQPIVLITEEGREEEAVTRLARVGYDNTIGYLAGGVNAWKEAGKEVDTVESISPEEFANRYKANEVPKVVDVRKASEFGSQRINGENVLNIPLDFINANMAEFPQAEKMYIHCAGGYRSVIAASILKSRGYHDLANVEGGFNAIEEEKLLTVSEYVCPSTML